MPFKSLISSNRLHSLLTGFLCAGASALFLALANMYETLWLVSFVALVPFFWWTSRTSSYTGATWAGLVMGLCLGLATNGDPAFTAPGAVIQRVIVLAAVFGAFGYLVCWTERKMGFSPVAIALLWFPLEYAFMCLAGSGTIMTLSPAGTILSVDVLTVVGFLLGSFVVVLVNGLNLLLMRFIYGVLHATEKSNPRPRKLLLRRPTHLLIRNDWFEYPDGLSPPPSNCS
jgi:hypothetical protein